MTTEQVQQLFQARCSDLQIESKEKQFKKFFYSCMSRCTRKRLNLANMFLGPVTAQLISRWLLTDRIDITYLNLSENKLGDKGVEILAPALAKNQSLIMVDLSQNGLTPKCSYMIASVLSQNCSIIDLNLGSIQGSNRNRFGKEGGYALAYAFSFNHCLIQYLHLRAITIGNQEVDVLIEALQDYLYLLHLDLSHNRLEGTRGGAVISRIFQRKCQQRGGQDLQYLNLYGNKLGSGGFAAITHQLIVNDYENLTLDVSNNNIQEIRFFVSLDHNSDRSFDVTNLILDGNIFQARTYSKLAALLAHATILNSLSLSKCKLGDEGLFKTFETLQPLRKIKKIDYSCNGIFDQGITSICPLIGKNTKTVLESFKFNQNEVTDVGIKQFLKAVQQKFNSIKELSFIENQITGEGANFVQEWLKKQRARNVPHNLNIVSCDLSMNKVMFKELKDIEAQLAINQKFQQDVKNIEIDRERRQMRASANELRRNKKKQLRMVEELKEVRENLSFCQEESEAQKIKWTHELASKEQKLEALIGEDDIINKRWNEEKAKLKGTMKKQIDSELHERMRVIQKRIDAQQIVNQEASSEITSYEVAIERYQLIPEDQKSLSYVPQLKKQLKEQEKSLQSAKTTFEKTQKELLLLQKQTKK